MATHANILAWDSLIKNPPVNAKDSGSMPGLGKYTGEGNGNPLQYSFLKNPMDRGIQQGTVHGVTKESDTTEGLNNRNNSEIKGESAQLKQEGVQVGN